MQVYNSNLANYNDVFSSDPLRLCLCSSVSVVPVLRSSSVLCPLLSSVRPLLSCNALQCATMPLAASLTRVNRFKVKSPCRAYRVLKCPLRALYVYLCYVKYYSVLVLMIRT